MKTPPEQAAAPNENSPSPKVAVAAKRRFLPHGCLQWSLVVFLLFVLVGLALPTMGGTCVKGSQTKALAQAKQIGLALRLFAGDNDGAYPRQGVPVLLKDSPTNSNQAFACLFPTYVQSELIFGNKLSAYQSARGPDNVIDNPYTGRPVETLRPGENVYGYVMGLTDGINPSAPLVVDGSDGTGHYNTAERIRGGTWKEAKRAVVIRLDNSGSIENLAGPDNTLYLPRPGDRSKNLLEASALGKDARYLDPAVAGP